jgi:hypothetical protein
MKKKAVILVVTLVVINYVANMEREVRITLNMGKLLPKKEEVSGGKAHTNILMVTDIFLSQKRNT